jgi:hypothetical protein
MVARNTLARAIASARSRLATELTPGRTSSESGERSARRHGQGVRRREPHRTRPRRRREPVVERLALELECGERSRDGLVGHLGTQRARDRIQPRRLALQRRGARREPLELGARARTGEARVQGASQRTSARELHARPGSQRARAVHESRSPRLLVRGGDAPWRVLEHAPHREAQRLRELALLGEDDVGILERGWRGCLPLAIGPLQVKVVHRTDPALLRLAAREHGRGSALEVERGRIPQFHQPHRGPCWPGAVEQVRPVRA